MLRQDSSNNEKRKFICCKHNESYISYCEKCNQDLCMSCEKSHNNHNIIYFGRIMPDLNEVNKSIKKFEEYIEVLKKNIEEIKNKLNEIVINVENFYNMNLEVINIYNMKKRNYELITNVKDIINNSLIKDLEIIINENNISKKFNYIIEIDNKLAKQKIIKNKLAPIYKSKTLSSKVVTTQLQPKFSHDNDNIPCSLPQF